MSSIFFVIVQVPLFREVFRCRIAPESRGQQREIVPKVQFLCIAQRVTANEGNSNAAKSAPGRGLTDGLDLREASILQMNISTRKSVSDTGRTRRLCSREKLSGI